VTDAELAILGLLAEKPGHGYEIETIIEARGMREWTAIGFSSIYFLLKKLEGAGLVQTVSTRHTGTRDRKVFAITSEGRDACVEASLKALSDLRPLFPPVLLGLANFPLLSENDVQAAWQERKRQVAERLARIEAKRQAESSLPAFVDAIFSYSLALLRAEQTWLNKVQLIEDRAMKHDIRKERKDLYAPKAAVFSQVEVPPMAFLMIDGVGDPNTSPHYKEAIEALYTVSYTLKFLSKNNLDQDYVVRPLEGLWWADDMSAFERGAKDEWRWTMMIGQPDWITDDMVSIAISTTRTKKAVAAVELLRFERLHEGQSVQILHIGSYDDEAPLLKKLRTEFLPQNRLVENGRHHEIYLSDARKTASEKLKTILRQPVKPASSGY
jgi:DNA-binding PadR family transcriptional regulator